jgi:hypothetical protein
MYKVILIVVITIMGNNIFAQKSTTTSIAENWLNYTDTANNVTVSYPTSWTFKKGEKTIFMITSPKEFEEDKFRENVNMIVRKLPNDGAGVSLNDISEAVLAKIPTAVDEYKLNYNNELLWNGSKAMEISYSGKAKEAGTPISFIQRICLNAGKLMVLTYTAEGNKKDVYAPVLVKIIDGIKF